MTDITKRLAEALLPCPFCGAPANSPHRANTRASNWTVDCSAYCCNVSWHKTPGEAILAWNRRAAYDAQAGKASGWQPIETAPEDEPILTAYKYGLGHAIAFKKDGFFIGHEGTNYGAGNVRFTHWMPLPDPPEQST